MNELTEKRTPELIGAEIRKIVSIGKDVRLRLAVEIGRRLYEAKRALKHGEWLPWLERETEFSNSSAQRYMKLFDEYGNRPMPEDWENLNLSEAMWLIAVPEEEKDAVVKEINAADMSVRELKKELGKRYGEKNGEKNRIQSNAADVELKPCPFCGGRAELLIKGDKGQDGDIAGYIMVKCTVCESAGKGRYYHGPDLDKWDHKLSESIGAAKAVEIWNMRWKG